MQAQKVHERRDVLSANDHRRLGRELGLFSVNEHVQSFSTIDEVAAHCLHWQERRHDLDYEIDGVVIKLNDLAAREEMGSTSHHPRWAFAFKFEPRKEITRLAKIIASVGRTGVVTPVAMLRPVEIGGVRMIWRPPPLSATRVRTGTGAGR